MPFNVKLYPSDWQERRARILARAGNRCERCGVENGAVGWRDTEGEFRREIGHDEDGMPYTRQMLKMAGWFRIVLTIAHTTEGGPLDCPDSELQALCQRCHNKLDAPMRARHRREKAHAKKACGVLEMGE